MDRTLLPSAAASSCLLRVPPSLTLAALPLSDSFSSGNLNIQILHTFDFSAELARMCTVVEEDGGCRRLALVKGAPESVAALCDPSTVPEDLLARGLGDNCPCL